MDDTSDVERNAEGDAPPDPKERDASGRTAAQRAAGVPPGIQPGEVRNPHGSSAKQRFQTAIRRELRKLMREGDEDELTRVAAEFVRLMLESKDETKLGAIRSFQDREDGALERAIVGARGADGERQPIRVEMILHDLAEEATPAKDVREDEPPQPVREPEV